MQNKNNIYDVVIIGSGAAGISLALNLSENLKVAIISKGSLTESNTFYAQGGIAAVLDKKDSLKAHIEDTIKAGAGLCNEKTVSFVVENAKESIEWLIDTGVNFNQTKNQKGVSFFHLTREGGHSHRRVLHNDDTTGSEIELKLSKKLATKKNTTVFEDHTAINLIKKDGKCVGVYLYDNKKDQVKTFSSKFTVLATGGASKVYLYTSNPDCSSGDGIAMAHRIGAKISHMEFNQFHPTCLYHPKAKSFLVTEAVRGEGGKLLLPNGKRFMPEFDERAELAPRDIVARAIDHEMKRLGLDCVYLDITHKEKNFILEHFPNVYSKCLEFGFDMSKEPLPVVPAAHYTCGGVKVDLNGRSSMKNLYAIGETSFTGLHGANRMASNSLLECVVFAKAAALDIATRVNKTSYPNSIPAWDESLVEDSDEEIVVSHNWAELRQFMWDYVGIVRTNKRLSRATHRIALLKKEINEYYSNFRVTKNLLELRNLVEIADLMVKAALARKQNIGLHYNLDNIKD